MLCTTTSTMRYTNTHALYLEVDAKMILLQRDRPLSAVPVCNRQLHQHYSGHRHTAGRTNEYFAKTHRANRFHPVIMPDSNDITHPSGTAEAHRLLRLTGSTVLVSRDFRRTMSLAAFAAAAACCAAVALSKIAPRI